MNNLSRNSLFLIVLLSLLVGGCTAYIPLQRQQTSQIARGASQAQVDLALKNASVLLSHQFSANGKQFLAKHYDLQTGTRREIVPRCPGRRRGCMPAFIEMPIVDSYVVIFDEQTGQVFAWGMVEELSRSPDDNISSIMPILKNSYAIARSKQ